MPKRCIYLKVTKDEYELPLIVAGCAEELAQADGVKTSSIYSSISHYERGDFKGQYRRVYDEGNEE